MSVDYFSFPEQYTSMPSNCLFLNDLCPKIYLEKINGQFSNNLDFTI